MAEIFDFLFVAHATPRGVRQIYQRLCTGAMIGERLLAHEEVPWYPEEPDEVKMSIIMRIATRNAREAQQASQSSGQQSRERLASVRLAAITSSATQQQVVDITAAMMHASEYPWCFRHTSEAEQRHVRGSRSVSSSH